MTGPLVPTRHRQKEACPQRYVMADFKHKLSIEKLNAENLEVLLLLVLAKWITMSMLPPPNKAVLNTQYNKDERINA